MTVDNLLSATVVTADGAVSKVSATAEPDLFWALRGGGGNFGVATSFEFQLHPVGPEVYAGLVVYPFVQARQVLRAWRDFTKTTPDELSVWTVMRKAPSEAMPHATGSGYVNFLTEDEAERVAASYGTNYPRLQAAKQRYDPGNLFRMNLNIEPPATSRHPASA